MSLLDRVRDCARVTPGRYRPFRVGGRALGRVAAETAALLEPYAAVFRVADDAVDLAPGIEGFEDRSRAVADVLAELRDAGHVSGWRDEAYPVGPAFSAPALFTMERAAVPLFGVRGYGVHVNGFVRDGDGIKMWIGRRSRNKPTGALKFDQVVAGGQPAGMSLADNLIKECQEEAGIDAATAATARPVGTVSYITERPEGLRDDVLFNYDLELPAGFTPVNEDGEVEEFHLWPMERIVQTLEAGDAFKFNSGLVVVDFLVRHGIIGPDHADYVAITEGLHRRDPGGPEI